MKIFRDFISNIYVNSCLCLMIFTMSCTNTPNVSVNDDTTLQSQLNYSVSSVPQMNTFFCNLNLNEDLTFEQKYAHISSNMQNEYNMANPWTVNQSVQFKNQMIEYFVEDNNKDRKSVV